MADRIKFAVSATPIETITDENSAEHDILASEVLHNLGGNGDSVDLTSYAGTAANQGYKDAAVNYLDAIHTGEGTKLSATEPCDFAYIKNTGFKFSSVTALGASTTDCVMVVYKTIGWATGSQSGWVEGSGDSAIPHYFMVAWLKPGQSFILPGGITTASNKFDLVSGASQELSYINTDAADQGDAQIYCKTFVAAGTAATDGNAVEYLVVT